MAVITACADSAWEWLRKAKRLKNECLAPLAFTQGENAMQTQKRENDMNDSTMTQIAAPKARALLVSILKQPYAWPGGYERLLITHDGGLLCSRCCRDEATRIMSDIRDGSLSGWLPVAVTYEAVSAECARECNEDLVSYCDHCGREFGELA